MYFYFLDVWCRVFGHGTTALVLGATAIDVAGAIGILYLAFRRGGRPLLVWAALLLTVYLVAIDPVPFDIWNPSVTLLPFVASAAAHLVGDLWRLVGDAVGGARRGRSWCRPTWVWPLPWGPRSCSAWPWCGGSVAVRPRRSPIASAGPSGRAVLASVVVGFVAWLPPIVQELTSRDGNLSALVRFFTKPGNPHPISEGFTHAALQATLGLRSLFEPVALRTDFRQGLTAGLVVTVVAFVVHSCSREGPGDRHPGVAGLVVVELAVGVYAISRIEGPIQFYLVQWVSGVGFVLWLVVGRSVIETASGPVGGTAPASTRPRARRARPGGGAPVRRARCVPSRQARDS